MGVFDQVPLLLPDSIFQLNTSYQADVRKSKVDLGVGVYKNENLLTEILPSVEKAEKHLLKSEKTKTYLPIEGDPFFLRQLDNWYLELIFLLLIKKDWLLCKQLEEQEP